MLFTDDVRHPLVADCDDWEFIKEAMMDFYDQDVLTMDENSARLFRLMLENIYVMGYRRGVKDAQAQQ